jgi:hypothetical protein
MRTTLFTLLGVLFITSLSAQELSYFTGTWSTKYYQDNEEIKRKDFEELLKADTSSFELWQKHKKQSTLGSVFFLAELGSFVWLISEISNDGNIAGPTLATIGFGGLAIWIISKALNNNKVLKKTTHRKCFYQKLTLMPNPFCAGSSLKLVF